MRIFLNADDFGKRKETNRAIDDAFKQNLICSAGLIVTGVFLMDAVQMIEEGDYWDRIHLHINLSRLVRFIDPEDKPLSARIKKCRLYCSDGKFLRYRGLHSRLPDILCWRAVYQEIAAQYEYFMKISHGRGNIHHVDFHLWYNLTWPVSLALYFFTKKYKIKSVRYIGAHQERSMRNRLFCFLSRDHNVKSYKCTNIDYYLTNPQEFASEKDIEIYCHPDYIDGEFIDNSASYCNHKKNPLLENIALLRKCEGLTFVSWKDE